MWIFYIESESFNVHRKSENKMYILKLRTHLFSDNVKHTKNHIFNLFCPYSNLMFYFRVSFLHWQCLFSLFFLKNIIEMSRYCVVYFAYGIFCWELINYRLCFFCVEGVLGFPWRPLTMVSRIQLLFSWGFCVIRAVCNFWIVNKGDWLTANWSKLSFP